MGYQIWGTSYRAIFASAVIIVICSAIAVATSKRSKGSRCIMGSYSRTVWDSVSLPLKNQMAVWVSSR